MIFSSLIELQSNYRGYLFTTHLPTPQPKKKKSQLSTLNVMDPDAVHPCPHSPKSQTLCCLPPHSHRLLGGGEAGRGEWKARTEGYLGNGFLVIPAQGLLIHSFIQKNESIRLYYLVKSYLIHFTFECLVTYSVYSSKQHIYSYISTGIAHIHTQRQTCCI